MGARDVNVRASLATDAGGALYQAGAVWAPLMQKAFTRSRIATANTLGARSRADRRRRYAAIEAGWRTSLTT